VAPQVSKLIGDWMVAWLMNRVGVFTVVQMQHFLAKGLANSLATYGVSFDLVDAFSKLAQNGLWLLWMWITNGDISFVNWLRFRYSDVVVTFVLAGETCAGPPFLNGTFQGSVESTLDIVSGALGCQGLGC
jgi:hypothetical protein